LSDLNLR